MRKEMLVLAKSRKTGGYCVAGVEIVTGMDGGKTLSHNWIRPVLSVDNGDCTGAIPKAWCDGISVLDIIEVELVRHCPLACQPENWLIEAASISRVGRLTDPRLLGGLAASGREIWNDPSRSRDDQISLTRALQSDNHQSLMLVGVQHLSFTLELKLCAYGLRKKVTVSFEQNGLGYTDIPVTDPGIAKVFCNQFPDMIGQSNERRLRHGDNYWLMLSMSPPWVDGNHYILAAAIIDQTGYLNRHYG